MKSVGQNAVSRPKSVLVKLNVARTHSIQAYDAGRVFLGVVSVWWAIGK